MQPEGNPKLPRANPDNLEQPRGERGGGNFTSDKIIQCRVAHMPHDLGWLIGPLCWSVHLLNCLFAKPSVCRSILMCIGLIVISLFVRLSVYLSVPRFSLHFTFFTLNQFMGSVCVKVNYRFLQHSLFCQQPGGLSLVRPFVPNQASLAWNFALSDLKSALSYVKSAFSGLKSALPSLKSANLDHIFVLPGLNSALFEVFEPHLSPQASNLLFQASILLSQASN